MESEPSKERPTDRPDARFWTLRSTALLLVVLVAAAFPAVAFGSETFFYRDFGVLAYPTLFYFKESIWAGELPLWIPTINCGVPFLAQWGTMALYPGALVYLLLPMPWSVNVFCLAHLVLGGAGMRQLAEEWFGNPYAGTAAAVMWVFNGVMFSCLIWPNYAVALGWMPWVVWAADRALRRGGGALAVAALAGALQILSGVPEAALMTWMVVGGVWLERMIRGGESRKTLVARGALLVVWVAALTCAQILPFLDLLSHSQRSASFGTDKWALPLSGWVNFVAPLVRSYATTSGVYFQEGQAFMSSVYLGAPAVALAAVGLWKARGARIAWIGALAFLAVALAFGEKGGVYAAARTVFPPIGFGRYPVKFVILVSFLVCLLAAAGLGRLLSTPGRRERGDPWRALVWCVAATSAAIAGAVAWSYFDPAPYERWGAIWKGALERGVFLGLGAVVLVGLGRAADTRRRIGLAWTFLLILAVDAWTHVPRQNPTLPSSVMAPRLWQAAHETIRPPAEGRRMMITPEAEESLLKSRVRDPSQDFLGKRLALWSNLNLLDGIPKINGSATLQLKEQAVIQALFYDPPLLSLPHLADFLGAAFESAPENPVEWRRRETSQRLIQGGQRPVFGESAEILKALTNGAPDLSAVVFLPAEAEGQIRAEGGKNVRIDEVEFSAGRVSFVTEASTPALLTVAQSYHPGWRAFIDGQPVKIWKANYAFQAVETPAGRRRVELVYRDPALLLGGVVSALAFLMCVISVRRKPNMEQSSRAKEASEPRD